MDTWIIAMHDNRKDVMDFLQFKGTEDGVKEVIASLIEKARNTKNDIDMFDHSSLDVGGVSTDIYGKVSGYILYTNHCIDYTAVKLQDVKIWETSK